jgi:hypothetical protein
LVAGNFSRTRIHGGRIVLAALSLRTTPTNNGLLETTRRRRHTAAGMVCLYIAKAACGKVVDGSPCDGLSESDNAKGGVASNNFNT